MLLKHRLLAVPAVLTIAMTMIWTTPEQAVAGRILKAVQVEPAVMDISNGDTTQISWRQAYRCAMTVYICNLDGIVVNTLYEQTAGGSGGQSVTWDGRDANGKPCPAGAYFPIIKVASAAWGSDIHNPTVLPWGERISATDIAYDANNQKISYRLSKPALTLIRIGLKDGGPCLFNWLDWQPRPAGDNLESWDGMDRSGIIDVANHEKFQIVIDAFSVPGNSILLQGTDNQKHQFDKTWFQFPLHPPHGKDLFLHALHRRSICRDFTIRAEIDNAQGMIDNVPVVEGTTSVKIYLDDSADEQRLMREKLEAYVYIDGKFLFEGPQEQLPADVSLKTSGLTAGLHLLTVSLRTREDHVGTMSMKVYVRK